jgi:hypothetical protein
MTEVLTHKEVLALLIPDRSLNQRMDALAIANDIRGKRARLKRDVKAGRVSVPALIADPPEYIATMKVMDLLLATPKIGSVKAVRVLRDLAISPSKTAGGLSERQRIKLVQMLAGRLTLSRRGIAFTSPATEPGWSSPQR